MNYEELRKESIRQGILKKEVFDALWTSMAETTRAVLCTKEPKEVATILREAISRVDEGSTETFGQLIEEKCGLLTVV